MKATTLRADSGERKTEDAAARAGYSAKALAVNYIWLYIYTEKPAGHRIKVWSDDAVLPKPCRGLLPRKTPEKR